LEQIITPEILKSEHLFNVYSSLKSFLDSQQVIAVVCSQWGDTGKGKIVDLFSLFWADVVVRGTGGANAGHTFYDENGIKYISHLVGSGILNKRVMNILGEGVRVDPKQLFKEMDFFESKGVNLTNFCMDGECPVVMPYHIIATRIGLFDSSNMNSTGSGMSEVESEFVLREGINFNNLINDGKSLEEKVMRSIHKYSILIRAHQEESGMTEEELERQFKSSGMEEFYDNKNLFNLKKIIEAYTTYANELNQREIIKDTKSMVRKYKSEGKRILLEGAQGTLLDVKYGMKPYTTSTMSSVKGLIEGSGLSANDVTSVLLIAKCPYTSRVGNGPYPVCFFSRNDLRYKEHMRKYGVFQGGHEERKDYEHRLKELITSNDPFEKWIGWRIAGGEIGATTGRPRDVGHMSMSLLKYAIDVNTLENVPLYLVLTKTDVACDFIDNIDVEMSFTYIGDNPFMHNGIIINPWDQFGFVENNGIYSWNCDGTEVSQYSHYPAQAGDLFYHVKPNFLNFPWNTEKIDLTSVQSYSNIPSSVKHFYSVMEQLLGVRIILSTNGHDRDKVIAHI